MVEKRPRNNSGNGRKGVTFGPSTVRNFHYGSLAKNGVNSVVPAPGLLAKEKPGNLNSLLFTKRPNGQNQRQPSVPHLPPKNARRNLAPLYLENSNVKMAEHVPLGPAVVGASNASLWTRPKGGRRLTRKRLSRKRLSRKRS